MEFDKDSRLVFLSEEFVKHIGENKYGLEFENLFTVVSSRESATMAEMLDHNKNKLALMHTNDRQYAVRAQIIKTQVEREIGYIFVCSPWLAWLHENVSNPAISGADFCAQDSQLETQMFLVTQQMMQNDTDELTKNLMLARDAAQAGSVAKGRFISHVSHELRTPLNGVISAIDLIAEEALDAEDRKYLQIAKSSSLSLLSVINQVLDFSSLDQHGFHSERYKFNPLKLVEEVVLSLSSIAAEKNLELNIVIVGSLPVSVVSEKEGIRKVLVNLVGNAIKFCSDSEVTIKLINDFAGHSERRLRFEVEDHGPGIARKYHAEVFDPFWSNTPHTEVSKSSSGLGLSICKELVEAMGGCISLSSSLGEGSIFRFEVPMHAPVYEETHSDYMGGNDVRPAQLLDGRVLVVDDNAINRMLAIAMLGKLGLDADPAADGSEAIEMEKRHKYDLILMDISMPVMDGIDATEAIVSQGSGKHPPIVALTASFSKEDQSRYLEAGMSGCLIKPIDRDKLIGFCKKYIQQGGKTICLEESSEELQASISGQGEILDHSVLKQMFRDVGAENVDYVLDLFHKETMRRFEELMVAYDAGNIEAIECQSHAIGSSVLAFGFIRFGESLRKVERLAKAGNIMELLQFRQDLLKLYQEVFERFNTLKQYA
jgi:signal transduction histidine kinase/DNA-binding response OmpR family regulator